MSIRKGTEYGQQGETHPAMAEDASAMAPNAPRKLNFAENAILTVKVLTGFGLLGAALWGVNLLTTK
jgi:hypothetical protein